MEWISTNSAALQVVLGAATAVIWILYLQLLLSNIMRQRRPKILIRIGAGVDLDARCFVCNLGFEPIYIMDLTLTLSRGEEKRTAFITDRSEMSREDLTAPTAATNQGPLGSGEYFDVGSFGGLLERAGRFFGEEIDPDQLTAFEVMVIATTAASTTLVAAYRDFTVQGTGEHRRLLPNIVDTVQVRSPLARRRIKRELQRQLQDGVPVG